MSDQAGAKNIEGESAERQSGLPPTRRSVPFALTRARERVMEPIRAMLQESGLTEQQWRVLRVLDESGPLDPTRLAAQASLMPSSLSRILQTMVTKGFVARSADPLDRRRLEITILPAGTDVIEGNLEEAQRIASHIESVLGRKHHRQLLDLLARLDDI